MSKWLQAARRFSTGVASRMPWQPGQKLVSGEHYFDPDQINEVKVPNPIEREMTADEIRRATGIRVVGAEKLSPENQQNNSQTQN